MLCDNILLTKLFQTRLFVCSLKKTSAVCLCKTLSQITKHTYYQHIMI